jgi:CTP:molybdopterin cytidylyltransferase MocA
MLIKLNLTIEQVDIILTALGDQPYVKVADVIGVVRNQAMPQYQELKNKQGEVEPTTTDKE